MSKYFWQYIGHAFEMLRYRIVRYSNNQFKYDPDETVHLKFNHVKCKVIAKPFQTHSSKIPLNASDRLITVSKFPSALLMTAISNHSAALSFRAGKLQI